MQCHIEWAINLIHHKSCLDLNWRFHKQKQIITKHIFECETKRILINLNLNSLQNIKGKGICFRVSDTTGILTLADYILPSTATVTLLLDWLNKHL